MPKSIRALIALLCTIFLTLHIVISSTSLNLNVKAANHQANHTVLLSQDQTRVSGYPFQYTSFAGTTLNLTAYDGLKVRFALPDSWTKRDYNDG